MNQSPEINKLAEALAAAQSSLSAAKKDAINPHYKNRYATLQAVWEAAREVLAPNGLSVAQTFAPTDGARLDLTTTLLHTSGQYITGTLSMQPQQATPQGIGSAITYARRYALAAILGIVTDDDDDGNEASRTNGAQTHSAPARTATPVIATPASRTAPISFTDWKSVVAPKFIKAHAGKTLGSIPPENLLWWCKNYAPRPFGQNTEPSPEDVAFRKVLDAAWSEIGTPAEVQADVPY